MFLPLERRWSVYPQQPRLTASGIFPPVRRCAFKIKAVTGLKPVLFTFQRDRQHAAQDVKKLLALMRVRIAAAALGSDAEKMRLHYGVAPGQQLHAHAGSSLEDFPFVGTHL